MARGHAGQQGARSAGLNQTHKYGGTPAGASNSHSGASNQNHQADSPRSPKLAFQNGEPLHPELSEFKQLLQAQLQEQQERFCVMLEDLFHRTWTTCSSEQELLKPTGLISLSSCQDQESQEPLEPLKPNSLFSITSCEPNGCAGAVQNDGEPPRSPSDTSDWSKNASRDGGIMPSTAGADQRAVRLSQRATRRVSNFWEEFGKEQVVDETKCLNRFVLSKFFLNASTLIVVLNAVHLGYISEYALQHLDHPRNLFIDVVDICFLVFYMFELMVRLAVFRSRFFINHEWQWNCFDTFLVGLGINEEISKFVADKSDGGGLAAIIRVLRILKTIKMLRIIRVMRFFRELRLFLMPIMQSMRALFWTLFMLSLIMYIFGIILLQGVVNAMLANDISAIDAENLRKHFGSVTSCMISLFYAVTGGNDWGWYAEAIKSLGTHYYLFFFFYIAFMTFAVLNILTGIFVDSAMQYSSEDRHHNREELEKDMDLKSRVLSCLEVCDEDASGTILYGEFERNLDTEEMQGFLHQLEITREDACMIFERLSRERPAGVSLESFLDCAVYMKGPARSLHLHELMADFTGLKTQVHDIFRAQQNLTFELSAWIKTLGEKLPMSGKKGSGFGPEPAQGRHSLPVISMSQPKTASSAATAPAREASVLSL